MKTFNVEGNDVPFIVPDGWMIVDSLPQLFGIARIEKTIFTSSIIYNLELSENDSFQLESVYEEFGLSVIADRAWKPQKSEPSLYRLTISSHTVDSKQVFSVQARLKISKATLIVTLNSTIEDLQVCIPVFVDALEEMIGDKTLERMGIYYGTKKRAGDVDQPLDLEDSAVFVHASAAIGTDTDGVNPSFDILNPPLSREQLEKRNFEGEEADVLRELFNEVDFTSQPNALLQILESRTSVLLEIWEGSNKCFLHPRDAQTTAVPVLLELTSGIVKSLFLVLRGNEPTFNLPIKSRVFEDLEQFQLQLDADNDWAAICLIPRTGKILVSTIINGERFVGFVGLVAGDESLRIAPCGDLDLLEAIVKGLSETSL